MARLLAVVLAVAFLSSAIPARANQAFDEASLIRSVTDRIDSLEASLFGVLGQTRHALRFARFAERYGKRYQSLEEIKLRFAIFMENLDLIRSTNRKGLPYKLGINQYADLSWEEFRASRLGAAQNCSATLKGNHKMTDEALPETKDWREEGIVSPVKDQGSCGSCWTFSTTGALEAAYKQATGKDISLSEQQLVDCAYAFNNFGCNGGLPSQAFEYIKYNGGLDTEESYPYAGVNGICHFSPKNVGVKVADSVNITLGAEDELKHAVGLVRPVSVAFQVVKDFKLYKGGVYTSDTCGRTQMDVNHAVLAVGYGVENGIPYWLIKNSWGEEWGVDGYFKMEMGKNMCDENLPVAAPSRHSMNEKAEQVLKAPPKVSAITNPVNLTEVDKNLKMTSLEKKECNYGKGKWIKDDRYPLYSGFGCKQWLSAMWACRLTTRTDFSYEKYRWQPKACEMPEFEGSEFLRRMQDNKAVAFVGDSLGRQQFQLLMCMGASGEESPKVKMLE